MNKISPKLSIILPTYNGNEFIQQSIESCLNQTYDNIELIVIDDCSTLNIREVLRPYIHRIKYLRHEQNKGLSEALNTGFRSASGEYLTWTSDDNQYLPQAMEKMVAFLQTNNCEFVYSDFYTFINNKSYPKRVFIGIEKEHLKMGNFIGPCFLYSRKIKEAIGDYDSETALAEDYDYWIRISRKFLMRHIEEPLYLLRIHNTSLTVMNKDMVRIVTYLVMAKNNISSNQHIAELFIRFIIAKRLKLIESLLIKVTDIVNFIFCNPKAISPSNRQWKNSVSTVKYIYKFVHRLTWLIIRALGIIPKAIFYEKFISILTSFKSGELSFQEAKIRLKGLLNLNRSNTI